MRGCARITACLLLLVALLSAPLTASAASRVPPGQAVDPNPVPAAPRRQVAAPAPQLPPAVTRQVTPGPRVTLSQPDANETRQQLEELFRQYPPALRRVLQLDQSLLASAEYLAP